MGIKDFFLAKSHAKISAVFHENCHTLDHVPGKTIVKSLGTIQCSCDTIVGKQKNESDEVIAFMYKSALERGGNAVVNLRIVTGTYQRNAASFMVSYIIAYGEAVIVE